MKYEVSCLALTYNRRILTATSTLTLKIAFYVVFWYFKLYKTRFARIEDVYWIELVEIYRLARISTLKSTSRRVFSFIENLAF